MPDPSLLIVVPTLDSHSLLPRLLASLQQQSWPHWRLLFIDGHSGPAHRHWLEQCCQAEPRCRWIAQEPDASGIFGAMNQGFAAAGPRDWLLFWGSDDWAASPTVFARAVAALQPAEAVAPPQAALPLLHPSLPPTAPDRSVGWPESQADGSVLPPEPPDAPAGRLDLPPSWPDLLVCEGRYADAAGLPGRPSRFQPIAGRAIELQAGAYRRALFCGSTPPHQATWIGPGARRRLARYADGFRLSADLDYFLQLSGPRHCRKPSPLRVRCLDLELVLMASGGISGQQTQRRLQEVRRAYRRAFGRLWWGPFLLRYVRRLASLAAATRPPQTV